ncbi:uncharacterized protein [Dermacentor andersoni]|uniref:uncharacterized protein n=1 Tax=Dermacentor andersoni TaxID=34620 RepID=UPI00241618EC|nr:uncharacterized protein LOC129382438 [Dermacentor andersoni]
MRSIIVLIVTVASSMPPVCFGEDESNSEPADALRAIASVQNVVLAVSSVDIPVLRCLTADITFLDMDSGKATYTWHVKTPDSSERKDVRINYAVGGGAPDMAVAQINDDTSQSFVAQVVYSNYKSCIVTKFFMGQKEVCFLWEARGTEDAVPKNCLDAFKQSCGTGVTRYTSDTCNTN